MGTTPDLRRIAALAALALLLPACGTGGSGTLTPTVAPGIPSNVELRAGNRSATLAWSPSAAGSTYTVLRSLNPKGPFIPVSVPGQFRSPTTYVDVGLLNGTAYHYRVVASNRFGQSPPSEIVSGTPAFKAVAVSAGPGSLDHLALLGDGSVWEWGQTAAGTSSVVPVQVANLFDITAVSAGRSHNLALASDGSVWSWGDNTYGQVGGGAPIFGPVPIAEPVRVPGMTNAIGVAAGERHSLALAADGTVWGWGDSPIAMGSGPAGSSPTPTPVAGLSDILAIDAGVTHSLALRSDGLLFSWGANPQGQLGTGPASAAFFAPSQVPDLNGIVAVSAGSQHSLALRNDGTLWSWGLNLQGQLGQGTVSAAVTAPTRVLNLSGMVSVAAGSSHTVAVRNDGTAWAWGSNASGRLGNGTSGGTLVSTPVQVLGLTDAASAAASAGTGVAVSHDGSLWTWGDNSVGGLGNGTGGTVQIPVELPNFTGVLGVAGGQGSSLAIRGNGSVWVWGSNSTGQFGNGTSGAPTSVPAQATGITTATGVASHGQHCLVRLSSGAVLAWGANTGGQIGNGASGASVLSPFAVPGLTAITTVACGAANSFAIRSDQTLWAWGENTYGQLGNGTPSASIPSPFQVPGLTGVVSVAAGDRHTLAATSDGTVWVWGSNDSGQLGLGPVGSALTPTPVPGLSGAAAVAAGADHSLALLNDGTVWTWGTGQSGQLGNGLLSASNVPVQVSGLSGVTAVAAGVLSSLALKSDGTLRAWGSNDSGQLGNTIPGLSALPVPVLQLTGVVSIASGLSHNLARLDNGTVWCWGSNGSSQLGIPFILSSTTPVQIPQ